MLAKKGAQVAPGRLLPRRGGHVAGRGSKVYVVAQLGGAYNDMGSGSGGSKPTTGGRTSGRPINLNLVCEP